MKKTILSLLAFAAIGTGSAFGGVIVYSNTTTDTLNSIMYTANGYTQIGDQVQLAGTERFAQQATVQFYNNGVDGTFDATLRFFDVASPVGSQIGGDFVLSTISIASGGILNAVFSNLNVNVPTDLIWTIQVSSLSSGLDLGLNIFEPVTIGSSNNAIFIANDGTNFVAINQPAGEGNLFFELEAVGVPEPATIFLTGAALLGVISLRRRK